MSTGRLHVGRKNPHVSWGRRSLALIPLIFLFILGTLFTLHITPFGHLTNVQAGDLTKLGGHVPGLIKKSTLLGPTDPNTPVRLLIGLHPRNEANLKGYVDALSRPHSTTEHRYLTPAQVTTAFAPLPDSQSALIAYMQQAGFSESQTYRHHLLIGFSGTIGEAENAFHIQINNYRAPGGREFFAPTSDPSVPTALSTIIQSVIGLDSARVYTHPPIVSKKHASTQNVTSPLDLSRGYSSGCMAAQPGPSYSYYIPNQIATAYNLTGLYNAGFRGEGQTVALYELDNYVPSDITAYTTCYGGSSVPISRIAVNGGAPAVPGQGAIEVELDMELVLSTAPHLAALRVYEAANNSVDALAEWSRIISDAVPIVSTSWGSCESNSFAQALYAQENTLFMVAAAQGQSIFAASGDLGSNDCGNTTPTTPSVDDPASQPYVTGVGGTTLTIGAGNNYGSETAWNGGNGNASGGGISSLWSMPGWQVSPGVISATSSGNPCGAIAGNYCREVPDVALNADPATGYEIFCTTVVPGGSGPCNPKTGWISIGGTSAGAPMWAGMIALANQKSLHDGNFNLGFLNPLLYEIGQNNSSTSYSSDFHDVQVGNNYTTADGNNEYQTTPNYDMVTGLGSFNALPLATDLESLAKNQTSGRVSPANNTWYFAEGSVGGSFSEFITLLNPSPTQIATVSVRYLFQNKPAVTVQHLVNPSTRYTVSVNTDLGVSTTAPQQAISAIVQSSPVPVVAERPMYFNFHGIKSGTDVMGATSATNTSFYFAEGDTRQAGSITYSTFISILNPSPTNTAHVQITYYSHGGVVDTGTVVVSPLQRGTGISKLHQQFAIKVTSDIGIVVERPMYFNDNIASAGGWTSGAASAVGATTTGTSSGSDWLFAEGYTGNGHNFQEYLVLANFTTTNAPVNVKLEYTNGTVQTVPVTVAQQSQYYFDVNYAYSHPVSGCGCTPTGSVSAEVYSSTSSIVAERLMYFHYGSSLISGGTDVVGEAGPSSHSVYTFAEGYTYGSFSEFLTLQNPNNTVESVAITLFANNTIVQEVLQLQPHSRSTVSVNGLIVPMALAYPTTPIYQAYEVSMDIQAFSTGGGAPATVVAERPLYFNFEGDPGGTDVLGYTGG